MFGFVEVRCRFYKEFGSVGSGIGLQRVQVLRGKVSLSQRVQVRRGTVGFIIFVSVELRCRFTKYYDPSGRGV